MANIDAVVTELEGALAAAEHERDTARASGEATRTQVEALQSAILDLAAIRDRAKALKRELANRNDAALAAAGRFFAQIATSREAIADGGALANQVVVTRTTAITQALAVAEADLAPLRQAVTGYDDATRQSVADAETALAAAETARAAQQTAFDAAGVALARTERALQTLPASAAGVADAARADLAAMQAALDRGLNYRALVHYHDLVASHARLGAAIDLTSDDTGFGASSTEAELTTALRQAWTARRAAFETAAEELFEAEEEVFSKRVDLIKARAEAAARAAERLSAAAAEVELAHQALAGGGGAPGAGPGAGPGGSPGAGPGGDPGTGPGTGPGGATEGGAGAGAGGGPGGTEYREPEDEGERGTEAGGGGLGAGGA
jgi:hypothetical protein